MGNASDMLLEMFGFSIESLRKAFDVLLAFLGEPILKLGKERQLR